MLAFKAFGKLILDVGLMVAYHCSRYGIMLHMGEGLEQTLNRSRCRKGRLLYCFPAERSNSIQESDSMSSWCGCHTYNGSLTGCNIIIGKPEKVEAPTGADATDLERATFALFMQPDWDEKLSFPEKSTYSSRASFRPSTISTVWAEHDAAGMLALNLPPKAGPSLHFRFLCENSDTTATGASRMKILGSDSDPSGEFKKEPESDDDCVKNKHAVLREVHRAIFDEQVFDLVNREASNV
ncbi:hypothetical protein AgCh_027022 [Apium graveolens]